MRLRGKVECDMLLGYQPGPDPSPQMLIQESGNFFWADVLSTLQEPPRQHGNGVGVRLHQVCHDLRELYLLFQARDLPFLVR